MGVDLCPMLIPATPFDEARRLQALHSLALLDTEAEERFDRITRTATRLFGVPIALVSLVDECRQWFKSKQGLKVTETSRDISFCGHAILEDKVLVVEDALEDPRFFDNPLVTGPPFIRFYAGCPLSGPKGEMLGTLCLISPEPRTFSADDIDALKDVAGWAAREVNQAMYSEALTAAREGERFFNYSPDLFHLATFRGRYLKVNPAYTRTLGWSEAELLATPIKTLIHPDDLDSAQEGTRRLAQGETILSFRHRLRHKDGTYRWIAWKGFAEGDQIYGFGQDVTALVEAERALKASEARYRLVTDASTDFIARCDATGRFRFLSPAFQRELGYGAEEALGRLATDFVHPQDREGLAHFFSTLVEGGESGLFAYRALHKDGQEVWMESRGIALRDAEGHLVDTVINTRNISERKATERMKQEFVSMVSHELRTPLTSIQGSLGLLEGKALGELPPRVGELVGIASRNVERLVRLVNDILDLDKVESGKMSFNLQPCELGISVLQALDSVHGYAQSMGTGVVVGPLPPDAWVQGDPDRIVQVLVNLLANAIKYSPKGTPVQLHVEANGGSWRVEVENKGPGIPVAFQGSIFQKFAQAEPLDTRQKGGTGLGLSIARSLVEGMGGHIGFTSEPESTIFRVDFPESEAPKTSPVRPLVLVVEDDPLTARLLEAALMKEGFEVHRAASAAEAKALLDQNTYHAMTLDLLLPDQHGLKLLEELRQRPDTQHLPVLVASSAAEEGKESPGVPALHVLEWVQKPLDPFRVAQALASIEATHARPTVLHVEDDIDVHRVLYAVLEESTTLLHAPTLSAARKILLSTPVDLVILDSHLPDGRGADLIPDVHAAGGPTLPILFFSGDEGESALAAEVSRTLRKSSVSNLDIQRVVQSLLRQR